jgi:hypothetical protein
MTIPASHSDHFTFATEEHHTMTSKAKLATNTDATPNSNDAVHIALGGEPPKDIFDDLSKLRLDQNFVETAGVKKLLTSVPVRKPSPQDFVRVHPDAGFRENIAMIELKDDREIYLIPPAVANDLPGEFAMASLYTAINRQGVVFLWPVRLPSPDGRTNEWRCSLSEAAERSMSRWIRVKANMALGAYEMFEAAATIPDPKWPGVTFPELLRIAFKHRLVTDLDHPVVKRLRGEV